MANHRRNRIPRQAALLLMAALVLTAALAGLVVLPLSADFSGPDWRFSKRIVLPAGQDREFLVEVTPDREVYAHASPGLSDLRIIEEESGREVQYKLLVERGEQRRGSIAVSMRDLGHVPGEFTSFVADLRQEGELHNELEIRTSSENFQRLVVVEGSPDGETWAVLQEDGQIFDLTIEERDFSTRDTRVQYPASTARYLRVRIVNDAEPPLEITGAVAYFAQRLAPQESELAASIMGRRENTEQKKTLITFDLGSQGYPTSRIAVTTPQQNFYRQVMLEGSDDAETWTPVQRSEALYAYSTPRFVGEKGSIRYPESTYRYYRLTVFNEDNLPLPIESARAYGFQRKLIFSADPGGTYGLYYGNPEAGAPSYELERIFPYLVTEDLPQAQLGGHTASPLFAEPPEPRKSFTERNSWLLPTVVALAALAIGLFLASLFRQIRKVLPPPAPP